MKMPVEGYIFFTYPLVLISYQSSFYSGGWKEDNNRYNVYKWMERSVEDKSLLRNHQTLCYDWIGSNSTVSKEKGHGMLSNAFINKMSMVITYTDF